MTYELCKQLKDAGFPQHQRAGRMIPPPFGDMSNFGDVVYNPALEELIEAYGDVVIEIDKEFGSRILRIKGAEIKGADEWYKTPDIAVAKLWLALNKKP